MRRVVLVTGIALVLMGCSTPAQPAARPTPTPINMDDMMAMAMYAQQTVFVATADHISAITLLNHFTRYQIPTNGMAEVIADHSGQRIYVLDTYEQEGFRLRAFDVASGAEHNRQIGITDVAQGRNVMSTTTDGRVFLLKANAQHAWVDAYGSGDLQPLGSVAEKPGCADPLLTGASRTAIVCRSTGEIVIDDLRGARVAADGAVQNVVAAAMADDGTLYVATAGLHLATVAPGASKLVELSWPTAWTGTVLPDSLTILEGGGSVVIGQHADDGVWLRVFAKGDPTHGKSVWLGGQPIGAGIVALWPFAYFSVDRTIRHVEVTSGALEIMAEVGPNAVPAAVVNG